MPETVHVGTILVKGSLQMPQLFALEIEPYSGNWNMVKTRDGFGLDRKIRGAGWNYIRCVVSSASGHHLSRETFGDRPALALLRLGAPVHRGQVKLVAVHQQNARLDTAKIYRNALNYRVQQAVELKNASDLLSRFLDRK